MIAKLSGLIDSLDEASVVIDVGGVGYLVFCPSRVMASLPGPGEAAALFVETHVREDHIHLYGFASAAERGWFRLLNTVQGVGARVALGILGVASPSDLMQAVASQDKAALAQAPGVGPKLAQRIVNELRDKVAALPTADGPPAGSATIAAPIDTEDAMVGAAVSALVNLGIGRSEAFGAVATVSRDLSRDMALEDLIRAGLQELGR